MSPLSPDTCVVILNGAAQGHVCRYLKHLKQVYRGTGCVSPARVCRLASVFVSTSVARVPWLRQVPVSEKLILYYTYEETTDTWRLSSGYLVVSASAL